MSLFTGKGDGGTTTLFSSRAGERHSKSESVFEALGTVDELNTVVGWCRTGCAVDWVVDDMPLSSLLYAVQEALFMVQAELAGAEKYVSEEAVRRIEHIIAHVEEVIGGVTTFSVPGGSELSARLDIARTVTRRAERRIIAAAEEGVEIADTTKSYINRLSSLFFALARFVNHKEGVAEKAPSYNV